MTDNVCRLAASLFSKRTRHVFPIDVFHKGVYIRCCLRAIVHVIGMLVHIQSENRARSSQTTSVIRRPLIDEFFVSTRISQQNPARAASERLAHRDKLSLPSLHAGEITDQCAAQIFVGSPSSPR